MGAGRCLGIGLGLVLGLGLWLGLGLELGLGLGLPEDALWVQVDGEDEWEWERATTREGATSAAQRLSAAHAKRKRTSEPEFATAEWLETRSAEWRQLALGKRVRRGEPITTERTDRACFVALHSTASGVRLSLALARRAVDPPPPTKRRSRRPRDAPRDNDQAATQDPDWVPSQHRCRANAEPTWTAEYGASSAPITASAVAPAAPSEACKACAGKHRPHTCGWQKQPRRSQESNADVVPPRRGEAGGGCAAGGGYSGMGGGGGSGSRSGGGAGGRTRRGSSAVGCGGGGWLQP